MSLTVGSLFSGIGGFDLGFERAGCEVRWQIEIDGNAGKVLRRRWPQATLFTDVNALVYGRAKNRAKHSLVLEKVDILCGGFPCQDLSIAGKRKGLVGARSGLFFAFMRAVRLVKPRWVVIENVPGLLSSHGGRDFHTVLATLAECGMRRSYRILDSQHFRLAQRRARVFIVGHSRAFRDDTAEVLFEPAGGDWNSAPGEAARPRVAATLRGRAHGRGVHPPGRGGEDDVNLIRVAPCLESGANSTGGTRPPGTTVDTAESLICFDWQSGGDVRHNFSSSSSSSLNCSQTPAVLVGALGMNKDRGGWRAGPDEAAGNQLVVSGERERALTSSMWRHHDEDTDTLIASALTASAGHHGYSSPRGDGGDNLVTFAIGSHSGTADGDKTNQSHASGGPVGLGISEEMSHALRAGRAPSVGGQQSGVRRLTPLECERLQGFPDGWTCLCGEGHRGTQFCICTDSARYKQLGNAVSVPVAQWIAERIVSSYLKDVIA